MDTGVSDALPLGITMYAAYKIRGKSDKIAHYPTSFNHIYCRIKRIGLS
jgi:hypothetical protein